MRAFAEIWIVICFICAIICVFDILAGHRQKMAIMNAVWPITMLYAGPIGLFAWFAMGRKGGGKRPEWQSVVLGTTHCGAGCTLGDFAGEWVVFLSAFTIAGSTIFADYLADFVFAYAAGIVFQYFAIAPMRNLGLREGVIAAMKADTLSLVAFEIGMFLWMWIARTFLFHPAPKPTEWLYWLNMQVAMFVGFATSMPANWYLLRAGLKEAM